MSPRFVLKLLAALWVVGLLSLCGCTHTVTTPAPPAPVIVPQPLIQPAPVVVPVRPVLPWRPWVVPVHPAPHKPC